MPVSNEPYINSSFKFRDDEVVLHGFSLKDLKKPHEIHAALLFVDLEASAQISAVVQPLVYDSILSDFQETAWETCTHYKENFKGDSQVQFHFEMDVRGDQLCVFIYDLNELARNMLFSDEIKETLNPAKLDELRDFCSRINRSLVYCGLDLAIRIKDAWLRSKTNGKRIQNRRDPFEIATGIHYGRVVLRQRVQGSPRIEGHNINIAKRIETAARQGKHSGIYLSDAAHLQLYKLQRGRYLALQYLFFDAHEIKDNDVKGHTKIRRVYELKSWMRRGVKLDDNQISLYQSLFEINPHYAWAYYQLFEYHFFHEPNLDKARRITRTAAHKYKDQERILANRAHLTHDEDREQTLRFLERTVELNDSFDYGWRVMATLHPAATLQRLTCLWHAYHIFPESPLNNYLLGMELCRHEEIAAGIQKLDHALQLYPNYPNHPETMGEIENAIDGTDIPTRAKLYLRDHWRARAAEPAALSP